MGHRPPSSDAGGDLVPFYESVLSRLPLPFYLSAFLPAVALLGVHALLGWLSGVNILTDLSWMVSMMTGAILALVIIATRRLRVFLDRIYEVFDLDPEDPSAYRIVANALRTRTMLLFGVSFGAINTLLGLYYGVWYAQPVMVVSILVQFFLVGGVCGFAISGIYGILKLVDYAVHNGNYSLQVTAYDRCGGMSQIGSVLLEFALVSLIAGLMIASYIYKSPWAHLDREPVMYFVYVWMGFPHIAAILVVSVPLLQLHRVLSEERTRRLRDLAARRRNLRQALFEELSCTGEDAANRCLWLNTQYGILTEMSDETQAISAWPFNLNSGLSFSVTYLITLSIPVLELWRTLVSLRGD